MGHDPGRSAGPEAEGGSPTMIGPFSVADPYGAGFVIPGPLTAGRPKPEPDERWTLGPEHVDQQPDDPVAAVRTEPVAPPRPGLLHRLFRRRSRRG